MTAVVMCDLNFKLNFSKQSNLSFCMKILLQAMGSTANI